MFETTYNNRMQIYYYGNRLFPLLLDYIINGSFIKLSTFTYFINTISFSVVNFKSSPIHHSNIALGREFTNNKFRSLKENWREVKS